MEYSYNLWNIPINLTTINAFEYPFGHGQTPKRSSVPDTTIVCARHHDRMCAIPRSYVSTTTIVCERYHDRMCPTPRSYVPDTTIVCAHHHDRMCAIPRSYVTTTTIVCARYHDRMCPLPRSYVPNTTTALFNQDAVNIYLMGSKQYTMCYPHLYHAPSPYQ